MAYYNKVGLLVLNENKTKFLVCAKNPNNVTGDWILPGGQLFEKTDIDCLKAEIREELACDVDQKTLRFIGEYVDIASGHKDKDVLIRLYTGKLIGKPRPSTEIKKLAWLSKHDVNDIKVSHIIRNKIIPDLTARKILL